MKQRVKQGKRGAVAGTLSQQASRGLQQVRPASLAAAAAAGAHTGQAAPSRPAVESVATGLEHIGGGGQIASIDQDAQGGIKHIHRLAYAVQRVGRGAAGRLGRDGMGLRLLYTR